MRVNLLFILRKSTAMCCLLFYVKQNVIYQNGDWCKLVSRQKGASYAQGEQIKLKFGAKSPNLAGIWSILPILCAVTNSAPTSVREEFDNSMVLWDLVECKLTWTGGPSCVCVRISGAQLQENLTIILGCDSNLRYVISQTCVKVKMLLITKTSYDNLTTNLR